MAVAKEHVAIASENVDSVGCELPHPARADALAEGGASCFHDALCRYKCIHRERSLHRRAFGVSHS